MTLPSTDTLNILVLERTDPSVNMDRFYVLRLEASLFGDTSLVRQWGRRGTYGREVRSLYECEADARETLEAWLNRKMRRGYRIRSFERSLPP
jgi:predicted DNA-binding WGR domain protein